MSAAHLRALTRAFDEDWARYSNTPTEFLRHLIRKDQGERAKRELEARLLEGLNSPRGRVTPKTFFKRMHALIDEVAEDKRKKGRNGTATRSAARG